MRNALLAVIGVGVGVWLLLNYSEAFLSRQFWIRWLPVGIPRSPLTLALVVVSLLILLTWASFREPDGSDAGVV